MYKVLSLCVIILLTLAPLYAENRIALLPFQNNGSKENDFLQKGIADMFTTAFSQQKDITVIERSRVADLLQEMELTLTGVVDEKSAVELGNLSGANQVVLGSFITLGSEIRIDARLVDVEKGVVIKGTAQSGTATKLEEVDNTVETISRTMANLIIGEKGGTIVGDPTKESLIEMFITNFGSYMITIDGKMMDFTYGYTAEMRLKPGKHHLSITKGVFRKKRIIDETFDVPGGYRIKMRFDSRKKTVTTYAKEPLTKELPKEEKAVQSAPLDSVNLNDVISGSLFMDIMHQVQGELYFDTQQAILSARLSNKALTTVQLRRLMENVEFDEDRLTIAKQYYPRVTDKDNFLSILDLFEFEEEKKELILWESRQ